MSSTSEGINERIKKYSKFGNDSSDEEDEVVSYDGAKAEEKLKEFNNNQECASKFGHNNLSFLTHAIGLRFLYSPKIQKAYYKKKNELENGFEFPDYDKLQKGIEKAVERIVKCPLNKEKLQQSVVQGVIEKKIYNNLEEFLGLLSDEKLGYTDSDLVSKFIAEITDPNGKNSFYRFNRGDLLGTHEPDELGNLRVSLHDTHNKPNTLDVSHSDDFSIRFFATLRLHNRLDKRKVRNGIVNSTQSEWKYSDSAKVKIEHGTERGTRNIYRIEWVTFRNFGPAAYKTIYEKFPLTLRDIDELPDIFTKGAIQISENAATLHYLLFGTEVMRNPSALIHNMMILDLMKSGGFTWKSAFIDKVMPMSTENAIMASRIKNSEYNENYMPHKYSYEHKTYDEYSKRWSGNYDKENYESATTLLNREKKLTKQWLEMKLGERCVNWFDEQGDIGMEYVKSTFDELQSACKGWYNVDLLADATTDVDTRSTNKRKLEVAENLNAKQPREDSSQGNVPTID